MPEIRVKHVVSCSSEDRNNPAENLLKAEGTHKWRTASPGEKNGTVVLQFEKSSQISSIDIGNEGSAFVEVLVGRSTSNQDNDYQVLLVSSSFMSPAECRNGTNRNAVRIFGPDKLSKTVASEKWDRVKIVCTQPFNKTCTYGLSFIKFHSPGDSNGAGEEGVKKLGAFMIKNEDSDDEIQTGTLFANRGKKETVSSPAPTGAAAVRAVSRLAEAKNLSQSRGDTSPVTSKPSPKITTSKSPLQPSKPSPGKGKKKHDLSEEEGSDTEEDLPTPPKTPLKRHSTSLNSAASSRSLESAPPLKKIKTEPPKASPEKEFGHLMEHVVFVLSGFQNPYRGELRDKALEMGAQYKPDWGRGCTHLICAFTNTPKYNQVKGRGRIVSKAWILDCYKQKILLPWRKYRLGDAESPDESSDEEEATSSKKLPIKKSPSSIQDTQDAYGGDTDSVDDTDEEIRRAADKAAAKKEVKDKQETSTQESAVSKKKEVITNEKDIVKQEMKDDKMDATLAIFDDSTDEDEPTKNDTSTTTVLDMDDGADSGLPDLPDFFTDKHFFFYGDFDQVERRLLTRYIAAYDGVLEDYMNDRVKYVVTSSGWDDNFEEALLENPGLIFVKPKWIQMCHEKNKLLPHQPYIVVP